MNYELTILINKEYNTDKSIDDIVRTVKGFGGKTVKAELKPEQKLAYPINGVEVADYYFYDFESDENLDRIAICKEFDEKDYVLRYLLVSANN